MILTIKTAKSTAAVVLVFLSGVGFLAACGSSTSATQTPGREGQPALRVVATTSIVADWVQKVGGGRVDVTALLPAGVDPHTFQPGARDVVRVAEADVLFTVGLNLEAGWLKELVSNTASDSSRLMPLGDFVDPLRSDGSSGEPLDPHFWLDPLRVKMAVQEVAFRLSGMDPAGAAAYSANASAYGAELDALHAWIQEQVAQIPPGRRKLVTSHESLGYFTQRYGFLLVGTVIPGVTTDREPSAGELADLVRQIRSQQVPAIFTETTVSDRLARRIAEEAGVKVVPSLYTESLAVPGAGPDNYVDMMRANVQAVVEALR